MGQELRASGELPDAALIERSIHQPDAFSVIFDRHFDAVFGYLVRRVGRSRADDLASATFTVAFERRERFRREATTARPWLFGIATNLLRNERRAEKRALSALGALEAPGLAAGQVEPSDPVQVGRLLARLSREQRDVLLLYAWEDLSYEEIAQALGVPIGTVRSRLTRARSRLRAALGEPGGLGPATAEVK